MSRVRQAKAALFAMVAIVEPLRVLRDAYRLVEEDMKRTDAFAWSRCAHRTVQLDREIAEREDAILSARRALSADLPAQWSPYR